MARPRINVRDLDDLDVHEVADSLNKDELFEFIVGLDKCVAEWDFTLRLCEHFEKQRKAYEIECAEDIAAEKETTQ